MNTLELEKHIDNLNPADLKPGGALHFTAAQVKTDPAAVLAKVCVIYRQWLRPAYLILSVIPFIGAKFKAKAADVEGLMDQVCPAQ